MKQVEAILSADVGVTSLLAELNGKPGIYFDQPAQTQKRPYIVIFRDSNNPHNTAGATGTSILDEIQVRVLSFADKYVSGGGTVGAEELSEAVRSSLDYFKGTVNGDIVSHISFEDDDSDSMRLNSVVAHMVEQTYILWLKR